MSKFKPWTDQMMDLRKDIDARIEASHQASIESIKPIQARRIRTEDAMFRVLVEFEAFLTEWLVRALIAEPSGIKAQLDRALQTVSGDSISEIVLSGKSKRLRRYSDNGTYSFQGCWTPNRNQWTLALASEIIVGESGNSLSLKSVDQYTDVGKQVLADPHKSDFLSWLSSNSAWMTFLVALRHCLAHRSQPATKHLNTAITQVSAVDSSMHFSQNVGRNGFGAYLVTDNRFCLVYQNLDRMIAALTATPPGFQCSGSH